VALLHGEHGTGKTNYIRYIIAYLVKSEKKVIYIPPHLVQSLSSPNFINFMMDNPNSVLIIEDGENTLISRDEAHNTGVANILNISDGLLGEAIRAQIICTFNTEMKNIDKALLRKGRIIMRHEFQKIPRENAEKLSKYLGFNGRFAADATLAEIYNQDEADFSSEVKKKVGYATAGK